MTDLPIPLTSPDCDLRDFPFMPLDVVRLRDSDLAALESPEACWAAVLLWAASWHQIPAGSVPDDDRVLANLAGFGRVVKEWMRVRSGALRGWIKCSDGRLYHPVVAEKAAEAWAAKLKQRWLTECGRIKKHCQRHEIKLPLPTFEEWTEAGCPQGQALPVPKDRPPMSPGCPPGNALQETGIGTETGRGNSLSAPDGAGGDAPPPRSIPPAPAAKSPVEEEAARLWRDAKLLLVEQQVAKDTKTAGELLGKHAAKYGKDVFIAAVRETLQERPVDAHTYLIGLCEIAAGKRQPLNRQEALEQRNRAIAERWAAQQGEPHEAV